ncbi:hypothetical protein KC361_g5453 [Hortaea werneckii]|nr:hypothetical protein KC361_g5453 [Hortaea werneckii]
MRPWQDQDDLTDDQLCSDCLLGILSLDQSSGFSYNGAFESDFSAITAGCGKTGYEPTKPTAIALNESTEATAAPTPSCASTYTVRADDTCSGICRANNVSTFALTQVNRLEAYCQSLPPTGTELCLPTSCDIYTVRQNDTCRSVAENHPSYITITQLQSSNPNLNALCTNMGQQVDTEICVGPPGDTLSVPSSTATRSPASTTTASVSANIADETDPRCARFYTVAKGDICGDISIRNNISLKDFYFLNQGINRECTNLFAGQSYCVSPVGDIAAYWGYRPGYGTKKCTGEGSPSTCYSDYALMSPTPFRGLAAEASASASSAQPSTSSCSIIFIVNKETSFGSSVRIVGSIDQFGSWDPESSLLMSADNYTTSNPVWDITMDLPCGTTGEYKYILDSDGTTIWETTDNRKFAARSASITAQNSWEDLSGTTITNAISAQPSTSRSMPSTISSSSVEPSATACSVTMILEKSTQNGQTVRNVGSSPELGSWNTADSVALSANQYTEAFPVWYVKLDLPFDAQYKYILTFDGTTTWESDPNRIIDSDACKAKGGMLAMHDTWQDSSTIASSTTSTTSVQPLATSCSATFIVERETQFGESVGLIGSIAQLGAWDTAEIITLDSNDYTIDNPVWSTTLTLPIGSAQYKYVLSSDGMNTWEADPNRGFDGDACQANSGSLTMQYSWQSPAATTTGSTASLPSPPQPGIDSDCSAFYLVREGDGCYAIANNHGISLEEFYTYNPSVGDDCSTLYPDYYVCVSVSRSTDGNPAQASSTGAVPAPGPTQSGIIPTCSEYLQATSGEYCSVFASRAGIST